MKVESIRLPAIVCALALPLCALAIRPVVEMGVNDDWSYIKTVQILAQTGHIVYNGWATAMLGWQLYLGALFVKMFGFSFTSVRLSMLLVAMAIAFLTQRTMVRAGLSDWNAALGTLVIVTSPLFLPLAFSFMTDVTGLFSIVLCLYACIRALQAETDRAAFAWLCFAALSNAISGTARQIAWLGVLVMVPSTLWLLRKRPRFLLGGSVLYVISVAFIFASNHWFHQQPYSVPESIIDRLTLHTSLNIPRNLVRGSLNTLLYLLPVLLLFIPEIRRVNRRSMWFFVTGCGLFVLYCLIQAHRGVLMWCLAPYLGNYVTMYGFMDDLWFRGRPIVLSVGVRLFVSSLLMASIFSLLALLFSRIKTSYPPPDDSSHLSLSSLRWLIVPFSAAYLLLTMPRAAFRPDFFFDRYLLPIQLMILILILRFYQDRLRPRIPAITLLPIAIFALFGIAGTHDIFAVLRARLAAVQELQSAGIPTTAIDGGFGFDGWTQIEKAGFINDPHIPIRPGDRFYPPKTSFGVCRPSFLDNFSALSMRYSIAYTPQSCLGQAPFAPVTARTWLGPHYTTVYIVNIGPSK